MSRTEPGRKYEKGSRSSDDSARAPRAGADAPGGAEPRRRPRGPEGRPWSPEWRSEALMPSPVRLWSPRPVQEFLFRLVGATMLYLKPRGADRLRLACLERAQAREEKR